MKIIDDTLKGPNGKWSRKSLTAFYSFIMAVITGLFIVVSDYLIPEAKSINPYAIAVFYGFLGLAGGSLGLTVLDRLKKYGGGSGSDE